jgi:hypothetical protein
MSDETPDTPRRTRRRATPAKATEALVGVMAEESSAPTGVAEPVTKPAVAEPARTTAEPADAAAGSAGPPQALRIERGGIADATAGSVDVRLGGIGRLDAEEVFVQWGGIGAARADRVGVEFGSVGASLAGELRITQGMASGVVAREATLEQSLVRTLIAQRVTVARPTGVLVMIAQHVSGDVRPVVDWRGALAFGAAFGVIAVAWRAIRGRA